MITDRTLDEALVELLRAKRALEALRAKRKETTAQWSNQSPYRINSECGKEHAAVKRATLDLTRKLADLRAGR